MDLISAVKYRASNPKTRTDQTDVFVPEIGRQLSASEISAIERQLKIEFPITLRRLYAEIGDGGFGPGYGFLAMRKPEDQQSDTVVSLYEVFKENDPEDPTWKWPDELLLISDWGCAIRTGVVCSTGQVVVFDPNLYDSDWAATFLDQRCTLDEWLAKWCDGVDLWEEIYREVA
jgi:hypothetical protein